MAQSDPAALGRLFEKNDTKRKALHENPGRAAREAGVADSFAAHLEGLNPAQRKLLTETWDELGKAGYTHDADGVTLNFF